MREESTPIQALACDYVAVAVDGKNIFSKFSSETIEAEFKCLMEESKKTREAIL